MKFILSLFHTDVIFEIDIILHEINPLGLYNLINVA